MYLVQIENDRFRHTYLLPLRVDKGLDTAVAK